jgi:hypothetical protein
MARLVFYLLRLEKVKYLPISGAQSNLHKSARATVAAVRFLRVEAGESECPGMLSRIEKYVADFLEALKTTKFAKLRLTGTHSETRDFSSPRNKRTAPRGGIQTVRNKLCDENDPPYERTPAEHARTSAQFGEAESDV